MFWKCYFDFVFERRLSWKQFPYNTSCKQHRHSISYFERIIIMLISIIARILQVKFDFQVHLKVFLANSFTLWNNLDQYLKLLLSESVPILILIHFTRFSISKLKMSYLLLKCHFKGKLPNITADLWSYFVVIYLKRSQKAEIRVFTPSNRKRKHINLLPGTPC